MALANYGSTIIYMRTKRISNILNYFNAGTQIVASRRQDVLF